MNHTQIEQMTLTEKHILTGTPDDCKECPVAMVLQENGYPNAEVSSRHVRLDGKSNIYRLGKDLQIWIATHDAHLGVPPIRLTICHYLKIIDMTS